MAKVEGEIEQARKQNDDKLIVDKENIDSMPEETSETLTVQKENAARWNNSTEKEQWEANVLNKLDGEKSTINNKIITKVILKKSAEIISSNIFHCVYL